MTIGNILRSLPLFRARARRVMLEMILMQITCVLLFSLLIFLLHAPYLFLPGRRVSLFSVFYAISCIGWGAFRWRLRAPTRSIWRQLLVEMAMAGAVLLELLVSFVIFFQVILSLAGIGQTSGTYVIVFFCGCLFFVLRAAVKIWLFWDKLRRTHLRWALTHAHLMVVVIGAGVISILLMAVFIFVASSSNDRPRAVLAPLIVLPVMLLITCVVLLFVLPPSALFSYLFARHTTRRIETLTAATSALRSGNYAVRVAIEGEDEIARLQADFNAMATDLERTLRELQEERDTVNTLLHARRELIATVSHELRTPVATVRSYLESTLSNWNEQPPPTLQQDLHVIEQQTIRLQSLINDLFTLARAEVKRLDLRCAPTNVALLIKRVTETMAPVAWRGSRVEVLADSALVDRECPLALVDEQRLEQVLQNLLHNGVRHTPPGGIVVVGLQADAQTVIIQVKDTGEGIPAEELPRIWERFYRTEVSRLQPGSGTGLGLAIVKELTEAMAGTVSVMSIAGQGTCFTLRVPRVSGQSPLQVPGGEMQNMPLSSL